VARPADERPRTAVWQLAALLAPVPGRLEFTIRLAAICALTTLVSQVYGTPEAALTAYVSFFVIKSDRTASVLTSIAMLLLVSLVIGVVFTIAVVVIDYPPWRVTVIALLSFALTFAASATVLKPIASTVALVAAYALDLLGFVPVGEAATRALLYAWLFVGIPVAVSIVVNLVAGPAPRRLAERALAHRLRLAAAMLGKPDQRTLDAFAYVLDEGIDEIAKWLKLAALERSSPKADLTALSQAAHSTAVLLSVVEFVTRSPETGLSAGVRARLAGTLKSMAAILERGGYPVDVTLDPTDDEASLPPDGAALLAQLRTILAVFAEPPVLDPGSETAPEPAPKPAGGFFTPDAFTNPEHVQYALKTTAAAMFCYVTYLLLDWPGIHTCFITCFIVSLGTAAETAEKLTLRLAGCLVGAIAGVAAILVLIPNITSVGALMAVVFVAAMVSGWIAAGSPRISYVGFQIAFAFFLCVIQGTAPEFDMTVARDRVIGILFGNLVVAVIFMTVWPASLTRHIDPAIVAVLQRLSALSAARSLARRWALGAEAQGGIGALRQNLDLVRYEPTSLRPDSNWLGHRQEVARELARLQPPVLLASGFAPIAPDLTTRLDRLAERFSGTAAGSQALEPDRSARGPENVSGDIEASLERLERLAAEGASILPGSASNVPA
jgi:multidrug resistance protein MdtO